MCAPSFWDVDLLDFIDVGSLRHSDDIVVILANVQSGESKILIAFGSKWKNFLEIINLLFKVGIAAS